MTISLADPIAIDVRCDDENLWVTLADGRQLGVPLAYFPHATRANRVRAPLLSYGSPRVRLARPAGGSGCWLGSH